MGDYLSFRKMITPIFIKVFFWLAILGVILGSLYTMIAVDGGFFYGLVGLIFGPIGVRMYTEVFIIFFNLNDFLREINQSLKDIKSRGGF